MAIKRGLRPSIAEVGKIKIGEKGPEKTSRKGNKFNPPVRLDYFKITTTERGEDGNYIEDKAIMEKLGGKPRELRIRLPFDTVDKNFFTQFMAYAGNKKVCAGDGEKAERIGELKIKSDKLYQAGTEKKTIECNTETCEIFLAGKCKVCGILSCFLVDAPDLGGVHKYRTHGWNATSSILGALEYFYQNTGQILQGLPLKMILIKKTTQDHGTINYATVVIDGLQLNQFRQLALEEKHNRAALAIDVKQIEADAEAAGFFADTDPGDLIQQEFYPEQEEEPQMRNVTPSKEPEQKGTTADDLTEKLTGEDPAKEEKPPAKSEKKKVGDQKKAEKLMDAANPERKTAKKDPEPAEKKPEPNLDIF